MSRHADRGRSFVFPTVVLAILAAAAALTVSILALRHNSSSAQSNAGSQAAPTTVYSTVTVSASALGEPAAPTVTSGPASNAASDGSSPGSHSSTPVPGFSSGVAAISVYVVQPGDNLTRIAQRLHEDVQSLYSKNVKTIGVNADLIYPGERLILALPS